MSTVPRNQPFATAVEPSVQTSFGCFQRGFAKKGLRGVECHGQLPGRTNASTSDMLLH